MSEQNDMQAVIDAAREAGEPQTLDPNVPQAILVPAGDSIHYPDLREWRATPARKSGIYKPADVESFVAYVKAHESTSTTVWVNPTSARVVAVLNDSDANEPGWGDHRAELHLAYTPEWSYWRKGDGVMVNQVSFAEHIEGGLDEIREPDAADMLEIAQSFHAHSTASFRSSQRLQSGEQRLQYDETVEAKAGATGDLVVPTQIVLAIAPFYGEDAYRVNARLRFRVNSGNLQLCYMLERPDAVVRDAIEKIAAKLREAFKQTYLGEPATEANIPF